MQAYDSKPQQKAACFCSYCGSKLDVGACFCKNCGEPVIQVWQPADDSSSGGNLKEKFRRESIHEDSRAKRRTVYDGELHKCPNCGELLKSFVPVCPACGYELRSVQTNSPIEALAKKVELATSLEDKIEVITNFYIPNTKEDIYDFFILAVSNLEDNCYDTDEAWKAKLEQAYHKARLSFGNSPEFEYLEKLYNRTRREVQKRNRGLSTFFRRNKLFIISAFLMGIGLLMLAIGIVLYCTVSVNENFDADGGRLMLIILGLNFIVAPVWIYGIHKEECEKKNVRNRKKENSNILTVGKDTGDFLQANYDDMIEFLKYQGFRNIEAKPEKKGLLHAEGTIKSISIAGNTDFTPEDEFDADSKIIIRYYSVRH